MKRDGKMKRVMRERGAGGGDGRRGCARVLPRRVLIKYYDKNRKRERVRGREGQ